MSLFNSLTDCVSIGGWLLTLLVSPRRDNNKINVAATGAVSAYRNQSYGKIRHLLILHTFLLFLFRGSTRTSNLISLYYLTAPTYFVQQYKYDHTYSEGHIQKWIGRCNFCLIITKQLTFRTALSSFFLPRLGIRQQLPFHNWPVDD